MFVLFKGALTGPSPVDRGRPGSKHHLLTDSSGITLTAGNRHDVTQLLPLVGAGARQARPAAPAGRAAARRSRL
jgi:hypothetical protein